MQNMDFTYKWTHLCIVLVETIVLSWKTVLKTKNQLNFDVVLVFNVDKFW